MEYKKEFLAQINLHSLRVMARDIGVKSPTALTKSVLIDEIIKIQSGVKKPYVPNKRGRPAGKSIAEIQVISTQNERAKMLKIKEQVKKEFIAEILKDIENKLEKLLKV